MVGCLVVGWPRRRLTYWVVFSFLNTIEYFSSWLFTLYEEVTVSASGLRWAG